MANDESLRWLGFVSLTSSPCTVLTSSDVRSAQASFALALAGALGCVPTGTPDVSTAVCGEPDACGDAAGCVVVTVCSLVVCTGAFAVWLVFEFEVQPASETAHRSKSESNLARI